MRRLGLLCLVACGPALPDLSAEAPVAPATDGSAERGRARLQDRSASRSGLACTDCHRAPGTPGPAEALPGLAHDPHWRGQPMTLEAAIQRCTERYQRRLGPDGAERADLVAALVAALANAGERPAPAPDTPAALYDAACRHCHEDGPAGPLLGRTWPVDHLRRQVLGPPRPGPDRAMPVFSPDRLPGAEDLLRWLAAGGDARLAPR